MYNGIFFLEGEVDKYVYEECGATVIEALSILSPPLVAWSWPAAAGPQVWRFGGMRQHQAEAESDDLDTLW